jgi:hypothetical protein
MKTFLSEKEVSTAGCEQASEGSEESALAEQEKDRSICEILVEIP